MNRLSKLMLAALTGASMVGTLPQALALPTVGSKTVSGQERRTGTLKTTAAACNPATATIDLDINNVRARMMTGGDMWWDRGTGSARYEVPKGSGKHSLFAGSIWVGGYDEQKILKVAGQLYRSQGNDYWPGPTQVDNFGINNAPDKTICSDWDKFWKVDRATLNEYNEFFRSNGRAPEGEKYRTIKEWPATGNKFATGTSGLALNQLVDSSYITYGRNYAPYINVGGDPNKYEPDLGDYPDILGDQYIWWVFNDMGNVKLQSQSISIGMEVQTSAFAFSSKDFLNDATFIFYKLINRGVLNLNDTYMSTWTDADLGYAFDDYIGCDTARSLGILYNGKSVDGNGAATDYGSEVPMIGVDFFIGPKRRTYTPTGRHINRFGQRYNEDTLGMTVFNYFNNSQGNLGDPKNGLEMYRIMTGYNRVGQHLQNDQASNCASGASTAYGTGPEINYVWPGNPERAGDWSECQCNNQTGDRRFVHSSGPFRLEAGGITNDIIIGACWVPNVGGCPNTSFTRIRAADDQIQDLFDNKFKTIDGPEAPRLVVREMDRKLVFYIVNDYSSSPSSRNYKELYGYTDSAAYRVTTPRTRRLAVNGDSVYKFEGYRVFQLKNSTVSVNNIFNDRGEVNQDLAQEVFETDIKNGVKGNIVNFVEDAETKAGTYKAQLKVVAKDSGIQHSFQLSNDVFATGTDKRFVNYKTYYFVAIAFAYNNFRDFSYSKIDSSQTTPYLESRSTANGRQIPIVAAMPNPANGDMGTVLNSDFGSGVIIKRLEGIGNGFNPTSFDDATESEIISGANNYQSQQPTYRRGEGPVKVKVVDPRKVVAQDWKLYIQGVSAADSTAGVVPATASWMLISDNKDTVYHANLAVQDEVILEKFGLSVNISQTLRPGQADAVNNGLISSDISFEDPNLLWLAGLPDGEQQAVNNWIRAGKADQPANVTNCNYADVGAPSSNPDEKQIYENLLAGSLLNKSSWAPVMLGAVENRPDCGFGVVNNRMISTSMTTLQGVDVIFTKDRSKWSKVVVMEMEDDDRLSEGRAAKFSPRSHRSWTGNTDDAGQPIYSSDAKDTGFSYFPGYAINTETGERLNIVFGEDSYLKSDNGADMIWNPSSRVTDPQGGVIFGGKHYIYVLSTKYDEGRSFYESLSTIVPGYGAFRWMGIPLANASQGQGMLSTKDGLIPTTTRIRIRVSTPYGRYIPEGATPGENNGFPLYQFSTKGMAPMSLTDADNRWRNNKQNLLDSIFAVPNPYYGYAGYETGRLDTRVRIINLPKNATINIYSTDGTLIRTLTKDNPNQSFVDWDTRNSKGLSIASGMYLIHVNAAGIGETVIKWFGAMRPIDLTTY